MSVQHNTYVAFGVTFGYEEFDELFLKDGQTLDDVEDFALDDDHPYTKLIETYSDSAFKPLEPNKIVLLHDGMDGKFVFFGVNIFRTDNWRHIEGCYAITDNSYAGNWLDQTVFEEAAKIINEAQNKRVFTADDFSMHLIGFHR